jgi:glycosyltransferase involved in cell wall biosynthesis
MNGRSIVYVVNAFEADAPTGLCFEVARAAANAGWQVSFVAWARDGELRPRIEAAGVTCTLVGSSSPALLQLLRELRPQVVQTILTRPTIYGVPIARAAAVPVRIAVHHGSHEWLARGPVVGKAVTKMYGVAARMSNRIVAVSHSAATELTNIGMPEAQIAVIPNGVDTARFSPAAMAEHAQDIKRQLFSSTDVLLTGSLGNLRPEKGYDLLVEAAAIVHSANPRARFVVWGDGPERTMLQSRINASGLSDVFLLPGFAEDARACLAACEVYVQPSRRESFGLATAEAMACGVPVVAAHLGGLPELVADAGVLVGGSAQDFAAAILKLVNDDAECERLGAAARKRIVSCFTSERMISAYLELYERDLSSAPGQ